MRSATAVYPDRSANTTVTWRRSSGSDVVSGGGGGCASGGWGVGAGAESSEIEVPHAMQNFAPAGPGVPQLGHVRSSAFPHDMQNFAEAGFSVPQTVQVWDAITSRYGMP